ncbi:MAG: hypothetical protein ACJAYU_002117 [Bradymonadia bacterium]|jgi:hypothetical protein
MPKARPLVQAALESVLGPMADKVLRSGRARLSGPGYRLEDSTSIRTSGAFPSVEFYGWVSYDQLGAQFTELTGQKLDTTGLCLHLNHGDTFRT